MSAIEETVKALIEEAERLPFGGSIDILHAQFRDLVRSGFLIQDKPWLNAFELASLAKLIYLYGHGRQWRSLDFQFALNTAKNIWNLAESEAPYSDDPERLACFILRFVYQQSRLTSTTRR